ncbi:MAG TPA: tetratricopeptide repeat protein [Rhizomicrobium sp.]|nr:tetratricopeptide repeat protein [Rhizomicrobium sp.]
MYFARVLAAAAAIALALMSPAFAAEPAAWQKASQLVDKTWADVRSNGILAVKPHVSDIEQALADGKQTGTRVTSGDTVYILTDGTADSLAAMTGATMGADAAHGVTKSVSVANPYPMLSLLLGSYYDEIGQSADALRVLDAGLALLDSGGPVAGLSEHRPGLLIERGEALMALHRFADALADFDEGLKTQSLDPKLKAHMLRGRGFALTELGRLDDAEKSYRDSLAIEPGNPTAEHELAYIATLRAGGKPTAPGIKPLQPAPQQQQGSSPGHKPSGQ